MFNQPVFPRKQVNLQSGTTAPVPPEDAEDVRKAIGVLASIQIDFLKDQIRNMADQIKELELLAPLETDPEAAGVAYREQFPRHASSPEEQPLVEIKPYIQPYVPETTPVAVPSVQQVVEISSGPLNDAMHILNSLPPEVVDRMASLLGGGVGLASPSKPVTMVVASRQAAPPYGWRF